MFYLIDGHQGESQQEIQWCNFKPIDDAIIVVESLQEFNSSKGK